MLTTSKMLEKREARAATPYLTKVYHRLAKDADAFDFICSCLIWDPKERPFASQLLQHPYVQIDGPK